jgi:hypothetical protein
MSVTYTAAATRSHCNRPRQRAANAVAAATAAATSIALSDRLSIKPFRMPVARFSDTMNVATTAPSANAPDTIARLRKSAYSEPAIETRMMLRQALRLALRQAEGLTASIFGH